MFYIYRLFVLITLGLSLAIQPVFANQTDTESELLASEIAMAATDLIMDRASNYAGTPEINLSQIDLNGKSVCDSMDYRISGAGALRSQTTVVANCLAPEKWRVYVKANVKIIGDYYVASRVIQANEMISAADVETREADLLRKRKAITNPENIVGWIASRRISKGSTISANSLRDPNSIMRGQQVQTVARGVGFVINGTGTAISNGTPGMQIQVRTPNGKIITGTVIDANTVQMAM